MNKIFASLMFLLLFLGGGTANAETCTYFVSSSAGDDSNNGTSMSTPWKTIAYLNTKTIQPGQTVCFMRGDTWRLPEDAYLDPKSGSSADYITYTAYADRSYLNGQKPLFLGSVEKNSISDWTLTSTSNVWATANNSFYYGGYYYAVGNLIFNNEGAVGKMEVQGLSRLDNQGEFYYDSTNRRVLLYSVTNPATYYSDIECALHRHMFMVNNRSYIKINNLDLRYSGSHGIWGSNSTYMYITDNALSFIGGAVQFIDSDGYAVRYGNAIEMYDAASNIYIERNRIWEIFDGSLSIEGSTGSKYNIYVRNNVVWNVGNCLYYYSDTGNADGIYMENNTCAYSGYGWGSVPQGRTWMANHFLSWGHGTGSINNFYVRNNIFYEAMYWGLKLVSWDQSHFNTLVMDYNIWYDAPGGATDIMLYCSGYGRTCEYTMARFAQYQTETGKDLHSKAANPYFIDEANNYFHPIAGGPVCTMSTSGSYVGALPCFDDIDGDGISGTIDNCPYVFNSIDNNGDGIPDDTNGDGIPDQGDWDGDGIGDYCDYCNWCSEICLCEFEYYDSDDDEISDKYELYYGIDDPEADPDNDGCTNLKEYQLGTNPRLPNPDSDGDGISDVCDPCVNDPSLTCGGDTDNDGLPDSFELRYHLNPDVSSDAGLDIDSDGLTNLQEYQKGTDPLNSDTDNDEIIDGADNCTFVYPVKIGASVYTSLQSAYDAAADTNIIKSQESSFAGNLLIDINKSVTLQGGFDCSYSANAGETTLQGNMSITDGELIIDNGKLIIE